MKTSIHQILLGFAAVVLALFAVQTATLAQDKQPASVNPTASSVNEQKLLEALNPNSPAVAGRVSIPDQRSGALISPGNRDWRSQQSAVSAIGGLALVGMLGLLTAFYFIRGRVPLSAGRSGKTITRFGSFERFTHWLTAVSFLLLALTGLNIMLGRSVLLPVIGADAFSWLTQMGKYVHHYVSFAFALGILLMFVLWAKDNLPHPRDIIWFAKGGGILGFHVDAARFNAGQKIIFWLVVLGGGALAVTGYIMMFLLTGVSGLQTATFLHGLIGGVLFAVILAHIYIGSLGMEGAFEAMGSGEVDLNWAKEHHSIWVERTAKSSKLQPAE